MCEPDDPLLDATPPLFHPFMTSPVTHCSLQELYINIDNRNAYINPEDIELHCLPRESENQYSA
jgi:hypothetical protein